MSGVFIQESSPHLMPGNSVERMMRHVLYALVPGYLVCVVIFGWGVIINAVIATVTALGCEALMLYWRKRPVGRFLSDHSAVVTALLLAICLPPLAPWWLTVLATGFAIVVAKHLYGGLGYNPFNPAMIGYVVAIISFPREMTLWVMPLAEQPLSLLQSLQYQLGGSLPAGLSIDAITAATPLDAIKQALGRSLTIHELGGQRVFGLFGGNGWEWISLAFLAGGVWLLITRTIRWQIPVAMLGGMALMALLFQFIDADQYPSPLFHLFTGGTMLGAFFIATDPVTASTTPRGRIIYGAGIGIITWIIRTWGGYPDGVAFSVLLMNMAVPTIDYYTRPRVYGEKGRGE